MMLNQLLAAAAALAVSLPPFLGLVVKVEDLAGVLITTAIFTVFGLLVFGIAYTIIVKATPFSIRKELEEDHNTALAIVIGSVILGIALIVSAAIQG
jgi:putative membrane protein